MPDVPTTPQNPSSPALSLRILASGPLSRPATSLRSLTSLSRPHRAQDGSAGKERLSVFPRQPSRSSPSRVQHNTSVAPTTPAPQAFSSPVDRPLKSSLKCTRSWSSRDAPTSVLPSVDRSILAAARKRVRFKDRDGPLESVCVFSPTGRPSSIFSLHSDSDSGSDDDNDDRAGPLRRQWDSVVAAAEPALVPLEVADVISQIPSLRTPATSFVRLESITPIPPTRFGQQPLLLHGIVHVCNIAYEKQVAARYTLDDWRTTSEIRACYANPLPAGPARRSAAVPVAPMNPSNGALDQWSFTIPLMLRAPPADPPRTLLLSVRFTVPGKGEWWDDNGGDNFRIVLSQLPSAGRGTVGHGLPALGIPLRPGPGLSLPSMWDVPFVKNTAAEFPRKPLAEPCSPNAQAAMAGTLPSMVSWGAPIPTAVSNRLLSVA